jgi:ribosome maturation protein Sdo1
VEVNIQLTWRQRRQHQQKCRNFVEIVSDNTIEKIQGHIYLK